MAVRVCYNSFTRELRSKVYILTDDALPLLPDYRLVLISWRPLEEVVACFFRRERVYTYQLRLIAEKLPGLWEARWLRLEVTHE